MPNPERSLFAEHVELLRVRGISADYALAHGVCSVDLEAERAAKEKYGPRFVANHPGLPLHRTTALLVSYPDDQPGKAGHPYSRARADRREVVEQAYDGMQSNADTIITIPRWFACAGPVIPYMPPECIAVAADTSVAIGVAESPIKALSIQQNLGIPCVGLGGVTAGCHDAEVKKITGDVVAHPLIKRVDWRGRTALLFFDAGLADNPGVALGVAYAAIALRNLGANVHIVRIPHVHPSETNPEQGDIYKASDQGPDDYLYRSGPDALRARIAEAIPAFPSQRIDAGATRSEATMRVPDLLRDLSAQAVLYADPVEQFALSARTHGTIKTIRAAVSLFRERLAQQGQTEKAEWQRDLITSAAGAILSKTFNGLSILKHDAKLARLFALNELEYAAVLTREPPWEDHGFRPLRMVTDTDATRLAAWLEKTHGVSFNAKTITDMIDAAAEPHKFHPVRQWLESLPPWDGIERLSTWMPTYLGTVDNQWTRTVSRKSLIAMMARAMRPGCLVKTVVILEGSQDDLKSTFVRALAPDLSWWSDQLPGDLGDKDASQTLHGIWIMELPELVSKRRSDVDSVKAYISRLDDRYRPSYGKRTVRRPRSLVFWGTTNDYVYLTDATGAVRWWPVVVAVTHPLDVEGFLTVRDQIYAEALAAFRADEPWWLTEKAEKKLATNEAETRRVPDEWEKPVAEWLSNRAEATTYEAIHALPRGDTKDIDDIKITRTDSMRMAQVFQALGWEKDGRRTTIEAARRHVFVRGPRAEPMGHHENDKKSAGKVTQEELVKFTEGMN